MTTTSASSYSSLLSGMWAPEGSELNDRLRRLQELENMRKEREARRQEILKNKDNQTTGVITRAPRVKHSVTTEPTPEPEEPFSLSAGLGLRRAMSFKEDNENKENFGGARPKVGGFSSAKSESDNWNSLFSDVKSSIMGPRRTLRSETTATTRPRYDSTDSEDSNVGLSYLKSNYSRSISQPQYQEGGSLFSSETDTFYEGEHGDGGENEGGEETGADEQQDQNGHGEYVENDDEGEEPLHFIERLKNGNNRKYNSNSQTSFMFGSIPSVPPLKSRFYKKTTNPTSSVEETEDIISVAKDISSAFGTKSPTTPTYKKDPKVSATYDIVEVNYDSSDDEEGKLLPVTTTGRKSEWMVVEQGPGDLDEIQAYFSGKEVNQDPNISGILDGEKLKPELEKSFSSPANTRLFGKRTRGMTAEEGSDKKKLKPKIAPKPSKAAKSPVERLKNSRGGAKSSGSENDSSKPNSESEGESLEKKSFNSSSSKTSPPSRTERSQSITDKLAKLESMTQEKTRRRSLGESDMKKSVPSYMSSTSSSQLKNSRGNDSSPKPNSRDLKKDVRELRQYVRENSVPNTPVALSVRKEGFIEKKATREISVQTDLMFNIENAYVCKHCGKSSAEDVCPLLTKENLSKTVGNGKPADKNKTSEQNFSSKDSNKSFGSTKSDKTHVKSKPTINGTASYMKGTTASRLKNSTNENAISPDTMLYPENDIAATKSRSGSRGTLYQKTKASEGKVRNSPSLSIFRGKSVERESKQPDTENTKSKLSKSKSVDQMYILKNGETKANKSGGAKQQKDASTKKPTSSVGETKIDLNALLSPRTPVRSNKTSKKSTPMSPRQKEKLDLSVEAVESKGQFTTIVDNPFIKNDSKRKNSFKGRENSESVWEKAENKSRDSSLSRPDSAADTVKSTGTSSTGDGRSLSRLSWSDSGSAESLNKSKSHSHGSNTSLSDKAVFDSPRSRKSSESSTKSHNAALNLLPPMEDKQNLATSTGETDIDEAYIEKQKDIECNEESIERAHLEFAKKACHLLDADVKKRDSSNEGASKDETVNGQNMSVNKQVVNGAGDVKPEAKKAASGSKKGRKGFLKGKGKLFRK